MCERDRLAVALDQAGTDAHREQQRDVLGADERDDRLERVGEAGRPVAPHAGDRRGELRVGCRGAVHQTWIPAVAERDEQARARSRVERGRGVDRDRLATEGRDPAGDRPPGAVAQAAHERAACSMRLAGSCP